VDARELWRRGQHGWPPQYPIAQVPNAPLLVAFAALLVAALTDGSVHAYARATFYAALAVWGWQELSAGANAVRRAMGGVALVYVVARIGDAFGA
jgi:hypothetical protein